MDVLKIGGKTYRVECNFNAVMAYAARRGEKNLEFLMGELSIPEWAELMVCAINEGERLEGREHSYDLEAFGTNSLKAMVDAVQDFIPVFTRQNAGEDTEEAKKK